MKKRGEGIRGGREKKKRTKGEGERRRGNKEEGWEGKEGRREWKINKRLEKKRRGEENKGKTVYIEEIPTYLHTHTYQTYPKYS